MLNNKNRSAAFCVTMVLLLMLPFMMGFMNMETAITNQPTEDPGMPELQGGTEEEIRPQRPVSNEKLQQLYPDTVVLSGPRNQNKVALTFDDGPDARYTSQVLDVLKKHDVPATFFLLGARAQALPELTQRIHEEGHAIGNHSYWHPKMFEEPIGRLHWEVTQTQQVLNQIIGYEPSIFRAPYGGLTEELVEMLAEMNFSVIAWSVDSEDWKQIPAEEIVDNVMSHMHPGAIILMHDGGDWTQNLSGTVESLDTIIPQIKAQGLEFVTVPELLNISGKQ